MFIRIFLLFIYVTISVALFATFNVALVVWISFFLSAIILFLITLHHLYIERRFSPFISCYIVFSYLFLLVAPIIQINSFKSIRPSFIQNLPYNEGITLKTNIFIILFNILFYGCYIAFKNKFNRIPKVPKFHRQLSPIVISGLVFITIAVLIIGLPFLLDELRRPTWQPTTYSNAKLLIYKKVLFLIPFGGLLLCIEYLKSRKKKIKVVNYLFVVFAFVFLLVVLFWFKNPLTEKRNALGPLYICLIFLGFPKLLNSNVKTLFFMFFSMIILFPLSAIITHSDATLSEIIDRPSILLEQMKGGGIANAFNTLNYDAFANIMATIDYVKLNGFEYGHQLLSAFLFFIPRELWSSKPISTGELVGDHLISEYDYTFSNLSNPLISEGYINFGVFGIIIAAIGLAYICVRLSAWLRSDDILKKIMAFYFAIHLIFFLRGDFTNGFSYYIGTLAGVLMVPKCIELLLKHFFTKQYVWKRRAILKN